MTNSKTMTKLVPIYINGEKLIQLSQLSRAQAKQLKAWLPVGCLKKINFQGNEFSDCLDFKTYDYWFRAQHITKQKQAMLDF